MWYLRKISINDTKILERNNMRFIGDIHADYASYLRMIDGCEESIQVGDFGIGFRENPISYYDVSKHKFIRGNHDWPLGCQHEPNFIPDGSVIDNMMFVGGAYSIDKEFRTEGRDWWADEELSVNELYNIYDKYLLEKPEIMICHEFPEHITNFFPLVKWECPSRTRDCFDAMFEKHKPKLWIGGHWHLEFDQIIDGCRFVVLDIHSYIDIDTKGDLLAGKQIHIFRNND